MFVDINDQMSATSAVWHLPFGHCCHLWLLG